jgi:N-acetyl sugar amidotransferase
MLGKYGLPLKVRFCVRCVISNQRPSSAVEFIASAADRKQTIAFNEDGVCDACLVHETKKSDIDWASREEELIRLSDQLSHIPGYNVVVPGSGGKDSAYTSHILKYKYGFRPLTVTWAPHLYTDIGWKNFESWLHVGGLDNVLFTPNGELHRHLTKLAFENLLHPFQPFIVGQRIIGPLMAEKFGIPLVFYGENQAESGNKKEDNLTPLMDPSFFSQSDPLAVKLGGVSIREQVGSSKFTIDDFAPYIPPTAEKNSKAGIEVRYLGYYLKWDPQECFYYAAEHTGFQSSPVRTEGSYSKYSSLDDKVDPFHYFTTLTKFGLGRASYDAAQEIRNEKITRDEGIALVRKFDTEFPATYYQDFLNYVGIDDSKFHETIDKFRTPHLWTFRKDEWELSNPIWSN